jgi:hypothetical protein
MGFLWPHKFEPTCEKQWTSLWHIVVKLGIQLIFSFPFSSYNNIKEVKLITCIIYWGSNNFFYYCREILFDIGLLRINTTFRRLPLSSSRRKGTVGTVTWRQPASEMYVFSSRQWSPIEFHLKYYVSFSVACLCFFFLATDITSRRTVQAAIARAECKRL